MTEAIVVAIITGGMSLIGVYLANRKSRVLMEYKIDQLSLQVAKHNSVIERTYELERRASVTEEKLKVVDHRITDLEEGAKQ